MLKLIWGVGDMFLVIPFSDFSFSVISFLIPITHHWDAEAFKKFSEIFHDFFIGTQKVRREVTNSKPMSLASGLAFSWPLQLMVDLWTVFYSMETETWFTTYTCDQLSASSWEGIFMTHNGSWACLCLMKSQHCECQGVKLWALVAVSPIILLSLWNGQSNAYLAYLRGWWEDSLNDGAKKCCVSWKVQSQCQIS